MALDCREIARDMRRSGFELVNAAASRRLSRVHIEINDRAALAARFAAVVEHGRIGYIVEGMDCDGTQYRREGTMPLPASLVAFVRERDEAASWLDGPESTIYVRPAKVRPGYRASRDRALEAFEDGHPHYLVAAPLG